MYKHQLDKKFGEKWVAALRDPKNKKTVCCYKKVIDGFDCFCAIGLAYHANNKAIISGTSRLKIDADDFIYNDHRKLWVAVTKLNDGDENYSFPQLADWLIENVEFIERGVSHA